MKRLTFLLPFLLAALLAACARPEPVPTGKTYTETDLAAVMNGLGDDWGSFDDPAVFGAVAAALQVPLNLEGCPVVEDIFRFITFKSGLDPQGLATSADYTPADYTPAGYTLARGTYTYDPATGTCTYAADTDNLVLRYPYQTENGSATAELKVDWGDTLDVADRGGDLYEVPTDMTATFTADGVEVASLNGAFSWYNTPDCGSADGILEPTRVSLSGAVGSVTFSDVGYSLGDTSLQVQGALKAGTELSADLTLNVSGTLTRDACFTDSFEVDSGSLSFGAASTMTDDSHSFRVDTNFSEVVFADFNLSVNDFMAGSFQGVASARLSDGTVTVDGDDAATFAGVLDDENANGTPGENVTIDFSGGDSTTLEAYLLGYGFDLMPTAMVTKALTPR